MYTTTEAARRSCEQSAMEVIQLVRSELYNLQKKLDELEAKWVPELNEEEYKLAHSQTSIIPALRMYRDRVGCSLSVAKLMVERAREVK